MSDTTIVTLRLPQSLVERADALIDKLRDDDQMLMVGRVSRSIVLRLSVLKGIEALETQVAEHSAAKKSKPRR